MPFSGKPILYNWRNQLPHLKAQLLFWFSQNRWRVLASVIFCLLIWHKDLELSVNMSRHGADTETAPLVPNPGSSPNPAKAASMIWTDDMDAEVPAKRGATKPKPAAKVNRAPKRTPVEEAQYQKRKKYVNRYLEVAQGEMKKYGIPASITLAQGLLESSAGSSRLSTQNNNHFGIKCHSRSCKKGHCSNFSDDSHKDFFRIYNSVWDSYRAHSLVLQRDRYKGLYKLSATDYEGWAHGLKKAGYATDPKYAEKLISIIEQLNLQQYDRR